MAEKQKTEAVPGKPAENERVYTIPLRKAFRKTPTRRVPYAARLVRSYLQRHMKAEEVKLGRRLNEKFWERGIEKPPRKIRVRAVKDGGTVKAELLGYEYEEFKLAPKAEKKGIKEKLLERLGPKAAKHEEEEKAAEGGKKPEEAPKVEQQKVGGE